MPGKVVFGGSVDAEGAAKALFYLFRTGYAAGLAVGQRGAGANLSVDVSVGAALLATAAGVGYFGWTTAIENVTGLTADPTNPRRAIIVAFVDLSLVTTATTNNNGAFKFLAVLGTPAASPSDPLDATIQSAVGAGNPYIKLGRVQIGAAASSVVTGNITDLRNPMALQVPYLYGGGLNTKGHLVPNAADDTLMLLGATQAVTGAKDFTGPLLIDGVDITDDWPSWTPTVTGFSATPSPPSIAAFYLKSGKRLDFYLSIDGTSNAANVTFTLPLGLKAKRTTDLFFRTLDNGGSVNIGVGEIAAGSNVMTIIRDVAGGGFTASGNKRIYYSQNSLVVE